MQSKFFVLKTLNHRKTSLLAKLGSTQSGYSGQQNQFYNTAIRTFSSAGEDQSDMESDYEVEEVQLPPPEAPVFYDSPVRKEVKRFEKRVQQTKQAIQAKKDAEDSAPRYGKFDQQKYDELVNQATEQGSQTLKKLKMYSKTNDLIKQLRNKLQSSDNKMLESRLAAKLQNSDKQFDNLVYKEIFEKKTQNYAKSRFNQANLDRLRKKEAVRDSFTQGQDDVGRRAYVPNNESDILDRHRRKAVVSHKEWQQMREEEDFNKMVKNFYSDFEKNDRPFRFTDEELNLMDEKHREAHYAEIQDEESDFEPMDEDPGFGDIEFEIEALAEDRDYKNMTRAEVRKEFEDAMYDGGFNAPDETEEAYQKIRDNFDNHSGSTQPKLNPDGDYVTHDRNRDKAYEKIQAFKEGRVYDENAIARSERDLTMILQGRDPAKFSIQKQALGPKDNYSRNDPEGWTRQQRIQDTLSKVLKDSSGKLRNRSEVRKEINKDPQLREAFNDKKWSLKFTRWYDISSRLLDATYALEAAQTDGTDETRLQNARDDIEEVLEELHKDPVIGKYIKMAHDSIIPHLFDIPDDSEESEEFFDETAKNEEIKAAVNGVMRKMAEDLGIARGLADGRLFLPPREDEMAEKVASFIQQERYNENSIYYRPELFNLNQDITPDDLDRLEGRPRNEDLYGSDYLSEEDRPNYMESDDNLNIDSEEREYLSDMITEDAEDFIRRYQGLKEKKIVQDSEEEEGSDIEKMSADGESNFSDFTDDHSPVEHPKKEVKKPRKVPENEEEYDSELENEFAEENGMKAQSDGDNDTTTQNKYDGSDDWETDLSEKAEVDPLPEEDPDYDYLEKRLDTYDPEAERQIRDQMLSHLNPEILKDPVAYEHHHRVAYDYQKYMSTQASIAATRREVAKKIKEARQEFKQLRKQRDEKRRLIEKKHFDKTESQVTENDKFFNFIRHERQRRNKNKLAAEKAEIAQLIEMQKDQIFDITSRDPQQYEQELNFISKLGFFQQKTEKDKVLQKFEYVLDCMQEQKVRFTPAIRARVFEYATLQGNHQLANTFLKKLAQDNTEHLSPVDSKYLEQYFKKCIQNDNFDGIAYLVNYCQRYGVDVGDWDLGKFRSAINYYLNDNFNVNKLMIFLKFYKHFYKCKADKELHRNSRTAVKEADNFRKSKMIFGEFDSLVDVNALISFLVDKLGQKQLIDPQSKQDAIWSLIDFFTQDKEFLEASQVSKNNKIDPKVMARYLGNQLQSSVSIDKIFKVGLRLDGTADSKDFSKEILDILKSHQSLNSGRLPESFTKEKVQDIYIKLRNKKLGADVAEMMLYLLKQRDLNFEIIDYCSQREKKTDLEKFYMSEALLSLPIKEGQSYVQALKDDKILGDGERLSPVEVTQKTKALFLDQGPEAAIKFMQEQLKEKKSVIQSRQEFLVNLYNSMFKDPTRTSFNDFKEHYYNTQIIATQAALEGFAVNQIESIFEDKDNTQIDYIWQYYTLLREERKIMNDKYFYCKDQKKVVRSEEGMIEDEPQVIVRYDKHEGVLKEYTINDESAAEKLKIIKNRKDDLDDLLAPEDKERLEHIIEAVGDSKITILSDNHYSMKNLKEIFSEIDYPDVEELQEIKNDLKLEKIHQTKDEHSLEMKDYQDRLFETFNAWTQANMAEIMNEDGNINHPGWQDNDENIAMRAISVASGRNEIEDNTHEERAMVDDWRHYYRDDTRYDLEELDNDPLAMYQLIKDSTLIELREAILEATDKRKQKMLPVAVEIFNRMTEKSVVEHKPIEVVNDPSALNKNIDSLNTLLYDNRSPLVSALRNTSVYAESGVKDQFKDIYRTEEDLRTKKFDNYTAARELNRINNARVALEQAIKTMKEHQEDLIEEEFIDEDGNKIVPESSAYQVYEDWIEERKARFEVLEQDALRDKYESWKAEYQRTDAPTRQQKLDIMRGTLSLELGENFSTQLESALPMFYALDLIRFGLDKEIPAAVRLGEKVIADARDAGANVSIPRDLAMAIKNFMVSAKNQQGYRDAQRVTGPINNTSIYHQAANGSQEGAANFYTMDDPYWVEFMQKTRRREDQWQQPSTLAWQHKQYGILGEIFDMQRIREDYEQNIKHFQ